MMWGIALNKKQSKSLILALLSASVFIALLSLRFSVNHNPSELFVFILYSCVVCLCVILSYFYYSNSRGHGDDYRRLILLRNNSFLLHIVISVIAAVLLEGLTVLGSPASHFLVLSDWSKKRAVIFFCVVYCVWFLVDFIQFHQNRNSGEIVHVENRNRAFCSLFIAVPVVSLLISKAIGTKSLSIFVFFGLLVGLAILVVYGRRNNVFLIEWAFLYIALSFSLFLALFMPITSGINWDDQIHYQNALETSFVLGSQETDTDFRFVNEAYGRADGKTAVVSLDKWSSEESKDLVSSFNLAYQDDKDLGRVHVYTSEIEKAFSLSSIGYIPSAVGLWVGRLLHASFSVSIILGRAFNAICYSVVFFFAIRIAPTKKIIFALCGLIPTSLFMAANYSYDAWLISMTALGFAYFLRASWGEKSEFSLANLIPAFLFMFLGLAVKAVYFPLIGFYFLVQRDRFSSLGQRKKYYCFVVFFGLIVLASFALPYLFTASGDAGDSRVFTNVNPMEQIRFILSSPLCYASILGNFFKDVYLNPLNASSYIVNYAYLGNLGHILNIQYSEIVFGVIPAAFLLAFGFIGGDEASASHVGWGSTLWGLFLFVCSIVLVATALYVSFTPVGYNTVEGCQFRYLLPLLIPFLVVVTNIRKYQIGNRVSVQIFQCLYSTLLLMVCTWFLCIVCM